MESLKDIQTGLNFDNAPQPPLKLRGGDEVGGVMTHEELRIWNILQDHQGKDNTILGTTMAQMTGIEYDRVRGIISHLIKEHDKLIASNSRGYWLPVTPEEVDAATKSLEHRGISILVRAAKLKKTSLEKIFQQARMDYEKENH